MRKSGENIKSGSSKEIKKGLKVQKDDCINSSKGVGTSIGATRVGRTSETKKKKPKKREPYDDEWDEDYKTFLMS